jgi:hypothetical protein
MLKIGDYVKIKSGASYWMKEKNYWSNLLPNSIDEMIGIIIDDFTYLKGNSSNFCVEFINCSDLGIVGINPMWLELHK